jgi:predicted nucleic acid-binding protein
VPSKDRDEKINKVRLYLETSVWNFIFAEDAPEKKYITLKFFDRVREGEYEIFISDTVLQEIERAGDKKKQLLFDAIEQFNPEILEINDKVGRLAREYVSKGIIPQNKLDDAVHASVATVHNLDALISWNLRHLANLKKMERINEINRENGYLKKLELITPMEVSDAEI